MKISCSIDINSAPEVVFSWLEKPEKAMAWMTSVSKTEILHEEPGRVGTTFRETVEEGGNGVEIQGAITAFEPGKSISFHLSSRVNVLDVKYSVESIPQGARLEESAEVQWKFPVNLYGILFGEKIRQGILAQLQNEFGKLKELCEEDIHGGS